VKKLLTRAVLCVAVLSLASVTLLAQQATLPGVTTINGGRNTVALKSSKPSTRIHREPTSTAFYSNIQSGSSPYNCDSGYTVSDGSPINTEYSPASEFTSKQTGTTSSIHVAIGFVEGTNGATVILDKNCAGVPCGTIDKTNLCKGTVSNLPTFGQSCTQVEKLKCVANLIKGHKYWVYVQSPANTWDAWNLANTAQGGVDESTNDGTWSMGSGSLGAFAVR
jgi:hypothetical protein